MATIDPIATWRALPPDVAEIVGAAAVTWVLGILGTEAAEGAPAPAFEHAESAAAEVMEAALSLADVPLDDVNVPLPDVAALQAAHGILVMDQLFGPVTPPAAAAPDLDALRTAGTDVFGSRVRDAEGGEAEGLASYG